MDEQSEWWSMLTVFSPLLTAIAAATVALLIRDLLEPRQWRRYVRKTFAGVLAYVLVFAVIIGAYILLVQRVGEDSPLVEISAFIAALGIITAPFLAGYRAFNSVEPDHDWFLNSRFVFSFRNGSWPTLSMHVRPECLPKNGSPISGRIAASKEEVGKFNLWVVVGTGSNAETKPDRITRDPRSGWVWVMRAVLQAQLGNPQAKRIPLYNKLRDWIKIRIGTLQENRGWRKRISRLGEWFKILMRTPPPVPAQSKRQDDACITPAQRKWQDDAYMQIHRLARMVRAQGVLH